MKKTFIIALLALVFTQLSAINPPDEGMWLPMYVKDYNYAQMQKLGLKLTPEQMYDINNSSLKDAIVQLGNFCTGEIISENGLMLTNHHCGYSSIADHSTEEHDYLKYGFWAKSYEEELPNEGLTATFLVRMDNVTEAVLEGVTPKHSNHERQSIANTNITTLTKANSEDGRYTVVIKPFFEGNEYYMFVYEVYRDVRLVGAPPSSIGKFGDETDNWVWPRHTGDFSLFRIYADKDGKPADYSPENVPLKPKHVLPINIKGIEFGDYAMVWGFPGTTDRFMTSFEIENMLLCENAPLVEAMDFILPVIRKEMNERDIVRINYASDYASMANTWKNKKGETASLKQLRVAEKKAAQETQLLTWINASPERKELYGNPMAKIEKLCKSSDPNVMRCFYYANLSLMLSKVAFAPFHIRISSLQEAPDAAKMEMILAEYQSYMKSADKITEANVIEAELQMWATLPVEYQPDIFQYIAKKYKGNYKAFAQACVEKSLWANEANFKKYLSKPSEKTYTEDPVVKYFQSIFALIMKTSSAQRDFATAMETPRRQYLAALKAMQADTPMYPDANSTMRCTYGTVIDYYPIDGVHYRHFTTAQGILEKEIPGDPEFDVDPKLKSLILSKDFGRYAAKDGSLPVCFITNNDITGGNSGSPVLNGNGELIGCAFDGNIEALSSNIAFDPNLQRCICVDARYILFVIDKFAGAQRLINEMSIIQ